MIISGGIFYFVVFSMLLFYLFRADNKSIFSFDGLGHDRSISQICNTGTLAYMRQGIFHSSSLYQVVYPAIFSKYEPPR